MSRRAWLRRAGMALFLRRVSFTPTKMCCVWSATYCQIVRFLVAAHPDERSRQRSLAARVRPSIAKPGETIIASAGARRAASVAVCDHGINTPKAR